jgi:hypothetical protein
MDAGDRSVLVLDDAAGGLGPLALQLLRLGVDAFYAQDRDEAWLLCGQPEAAGVRALVFPEALEPAARRAVAGRLQARAGEDAVGLVAVGELADEARCDALRKDGVEWALRPPFDESILRWVVNAALSAQQGAGRRAHDRVPTSLLAHTYVGERRKDLLASSLSVGGCFLETPLPFPLGTRVLVELPISGGPLSASGLVAHRQDTSGEARPGFPLGMGIAFEALSPQASALLAAFVEARARHFEI